MYSNTLFKNKFNIDLIISNKYKKTDNFIGSFITLNNFITGLKTSQLFMKTKWSTLFYVLLIIISGLTIYWITDKGHALQNPAVKALLNEQAANTTTSSNFNVFRDSLDQNLSDPLAVLLLQIIVIIAFARLSPIFPFGISNVIFTYLGVPLKQLILAGIIGMLPRTIFIVWLSSQADSLKKLFSQNWSNYLNSPLFIVGLLSVFGIVFLTLSSQHFVCSV